MAELLIRACAADSALLRRIYRPAGRERAEALPSRIVVPAQVVARTDIAAMARSTGVPLLIDPQAHFWQDAQNSSYPWTGLTFGCTERLDPAALTPRRLEDLVSRCLKFQLEQSASSIIVPGLHVENGRDGWLDVQIEVFRASRRFLDRHAVLLPVITPVQLSWRLLDRSRWSEALKPLLGVAREMGADEIALAAGKVERGVHPEDRLACLIAVIAEARGVAPVLAWHQGELGEACVAAGARGYECGIGWQEHCDLRSEAAAHRSAPTEPPRLGSRPIYLQPLRRSVPANSVRRLVEVSRDIRDRIACLDGKCCPQGVSTLAGDTRHHAVLARARSLEELSSSESPRWQWGFLAKDSAEGLDLAGRINRIAALDAAVAHIQTGGLTAIHDQAVVLRDAHRRLAA